MEHILDISTDVFEKIKDHETTVLKVPRQIQGMSIEKGDTIKLYHPGEEVEALRIEVKKMDISFKDPLSESEMFVQLELLEWMFRMETELDDWLREEQRMMEELL